MKILYSILRREGFQEKIYNYRGTPSTIQPKTINGIPEREYYQKKQPEFLCGLSHQDKETPDNTAETASKEYRKFREQCGYKDPVALDEIEEAYYLGMEKQKELMMKNATETSVKTDAGGLNMIHEPILRTQVAALYKEGWTVEEIAEELDIPLEDVIEWCNRLV